MGIGFSQRKLMKLSFFLFLIVIVAACSSETNTIPPSPSIHTDIIPIVEPVYEYGFCIDSFIVDRGKIKQDWTLSHLLLPFNISQVAINQASELAKDSLVDLKYITNDKSYLMLSKQVDSAKVLQYCIYDKSVYDYVVFEFTDSLNVYKVSRPIEEAEKEMSGIIGDGSNLSNEIQNVSRNLGITSELVSKIAQTFAWSIDFFRLHPGDKFKVIYDEKSVNGTPTGTGKIKALFFQHKNKGYYAFAYVKENEINYYDENGNSNKSLFLMAPLKFTRLSSPYTKRRFHPVQKRWKAHLGTDYAAPKGTPIWSTADGTVIAATYSRNNGYYVKIKHSSTYTTQYLHMTKIAAGMKKGRRIVQGETIGYVGSTGLATGPHVCYRFWKNGKQIDHRQEVHQASEPLDEALKDDYLELIKPIKNQIDGIPYSTNNEIEITDTDTIN